MRPSADGAQVPARHPTSSPTRHRLATRLSGRSTAGLDGMLTIESTTILGCCVLRPVGELATGSVPEFRAASRALAGARMVVLDLDAVAFIDSAGLGALIGSVVRVREAGGDVAVACSRPPLRRVLSTASIDRLVEVTDTCEDAARALR